MMVSFASTLSLMLEGVLRPHPRSCRYPQSLPSQTDYPPPCSFLKDPGGGPLSLFSFSYTDFGPHRIFHPFIFFHLLPLSLFS
jgi:hypothetical protein